MKFRTWINENLRSEKERQLHDIWADVFKALGIGGLSDEDAAQQSLSNITYGQRGPDKKNLFKGKTAVRKRLEGSQIFDRLQQISDPELRKSVEAARHWLDSDDQANASTTVSVLLQKLFGDENFQKFINSEVPQGPEPKAQVQPQPPKDNAVDTSMDMNTPQPIPPQTGMMGQQPQVPQNFSQPRPTHPMPPRPAGSELGMY
jgi:hypothetical protein